MGRIIEIANNLAILSLYRGFMQIKIDKISTSQIALSDIDILILNGTGATISTNLLNELLENGTMVLVLGKNYAPSGIFYPTNPHYFHKQRINLQINATKPLNKRLWQTIVKAKITNQAKILSFFTKEQEQQLLLLVKKVNSGDSQNIEAQAAKKYWQKLFGKDFRRDYSSVGINSLLNYGYAILRSSTARAVFACGLTPAIGIHHSNQENAFCLVDDLMEPYRPIVDFMVKKITEKEPEIKELTTDHKKMLSKILQIEITTANNEKTSLTNSLIRLCQSFVCSLEQKKDLLELPILSPSPIFEIEI
jgi:CRISPR-associated protein Cas1